MRGSFLDVPMFFRNGVPPNIGDVHGCHGLVLMGDHQQEKPPSVVTKLGEVPTCPTCHGLLQIAVWNGSQVLERWMIWLWHGLPMVQLIGKPMVCCLNPRVSPPRWSPLFDCWIWLLRIPMVVAKLPCCGRNPFADWFNSSLAVKISWCRQTSNIFDMALPETSIDVEKPSFVDHKYFWKKHGFSASFWMFTCSPVRLPQD